MVLPITISLLIELCAIVIASSAFLFYLNRLGGWLLATWLRFKFWKEDNVYITIGSIQLSLLAGRISFRDFEYHSSNISARALHGHVTWRYWKFRTKQNEDVDTTNSLRGSLPCRIRVHAEGVEAFIYNTTPAYDEIVRRMKKRESGTAAGSAPDTSETWSSSDQHEGLRKRSSVRQDQTKGSSASSSEDLKATTSDSSTKACLTAQDRMLPTYSRFHEMCPIEISLKQGSVILGNDATPSILIAHFLAATGTVSHVESNSPYDEGKQDYNLEFETVKILTRTNADYSGPLLAHGKKAYDMLYRERPLTAEEPPSLLSTRLGFHRIAKHFKFLRDPRFSTPPVAGLPRDRVWRGLARYREVDDQAAHHKLRREEREYAKVTTLVDTPRLDVHYYSDDPGPVPFPDDPVIANPADEFGNIEAPPEYGIEVTIHGGMVTYGPWADRQRDALQTAFAPSIFFDSVPKARLHPGDQRIHTHMLLNVNLVKETTLRIPTREPSKDWQFDGDNTSDERPYGWLDVIVAANSSVVYTQSQIATTHGYDTMLALHLDTLSISSSVNAGTFLRAKSCKLAITMPTPLQWDAQRDWGFDVTLDEPEITLMRDHTTLISDLARDWSSGLQGDFHHFVPNHYNFRVSILNYGIHLFVNDLNIIDKPEDRSENAMADFYGPRLDAFVAVSATQYRPEFSTVPFSVEARDIRVDIGLPTWDTHRGEGGSQDIEIGKIGDLSVAGAYRYYSEPRPEHQENLTLNLEGRRVIFKAFGWALRRLFCVKDNYFGGYTQFRTMEEFEERHDRDPQSVGDPVEEKFRPGRSDPFAVQVTMTVEDSLVVMPDEIYGFESGVAMPIPKLQMSLRSQDQFMDLSLDSPPTFVIPAENLARVYGSGIVPALQDDAIFLEGIELKANRLFGPQPRAETYLCLWEAVIPRVTCTLSTPFVTCLKAVAQAVSYNFDDIENAPDKKYQPAALPDVTFFKLRLGEAIVRFDAGDSAVSLGIPEGLNIDLSTWATRSCGMSIGVVVPSVSVNVLRRDADRREQWQSVAEAQTGGSIDFYLAPRGWREAAAMQQAFLRKEDAETRRIAYLYDDGAPPRYGQLNHQVYVPTPRPADMESSSDDDSDDDSVATSTNSRSSSPDSGGHDGMAFPRPRPRRDSILRHERAREARDWDSDESGSASTYSSGSEVDDDHPTDASTKLAQQLRQFRAVQQSLLDSMHATDDEIPLQDGKSASSTLRNGKVVKISLAPVTLALRPATLEACSTLYVAVQHAHRRPDVLLDELLVIHTAKVKEIEEIDPSLVLDLEIGIIHARAFSTDSASPAPMVDVCLRHLSTRFRSNTYSGRQFTDATVSIRRMEVLLCAPKPTLRLQGVDSTGVPGQPVGHFVCEGMNTAVGSRPQHTQITVSLTMSNTIVVSPAFESIRDIITIWQTASGSIPSSTEDVGPVAFVINDAVRAAVQVIRAPPQPPFLNAGNYGLHLEDHRFIRHDLGWSLLARLRHWMHTLPKPSTQPINDFESSTIAALARIEALEGHVPVRTTEGVEAAEQVEEFDETGAQEFIGDDFADETYDYIRRQPFMVAAFGYKTSEDSADNTALLDHSTHVFANIDLFHLEHQGRMLESDEVVSSFVNIVSATSGLQYLLSHKGSRPTRRIRAVNAVKAIDVTIQNSIFNAIEPLLSLVPAPKPGDGPTEVDIERLDVLVMDNQIERAELEIIAAGLRMEGVLERGSLNVYREKGGDPAADDTKSTASRMTAIMMISSIETTLSVVKERIHRSSSMPTGIVATWVTKDLGGIASYSVSKIADVPDDLNLLISLRRFDLDIQPQMKVLHGLINHVRQEDLPYYQRVVDRYKSILPVQTPRDTPSASKPILATVDISFKAIALVARAASSLWVRWDFGNIFFTGTGLKDDLTFGVRMDPQEVGAYSSFQRSKSQDSSRLRLPSISARGAYTHYDDQGSLSGTLDLGVFQGIMRPATLDRLLDLHRDLGEDIAVLSRQYRDEVEQYKAQSPGVTDSSLKPLKLDVRIGMAGVQVGLRADKVATSIVLEASALSGLLSHSGQPDSSFRWKVNAEQLGISLGHLKSDLVSDDIVSSRRYRSASMVLDVEVEDVPASAQTPRKLQVRLSKVHSIMHVAALKELVDLSRSWSRDIHFMQEERAADIAQVKVDGSKFKQKMQMKASKAEKPLSSAWLAERLVTIDVTGIGIAIPLDASTTIDLATVDQRTGPAMLFSIRRMEFENKRNQTANFQMQQMVLQFVDIFDQGNSGHFRGDYHPSDNRMTVTTINSEAEISSEPGYWKVSAHSSASDFELILSPSIADDVYRLVHMYHRGKTHIAQLEEEYRIGLAKFGQTDSTVAKYVEQSSLPEKLAAQQILVKMSFTFNSGDVSLSHKPRDKFYKPDRLKLPTISLWIDYVGASIGVDDADDGGSLIVNSAVHESQNTILPTIIPFIVDLVKRIRHHPPDLADGMSLTVIEAPKVSTQVSSMQVEPPTVGVPALEAIAHAPTGRLRVQFTLRIDQSKLILSCESGLEGMSDACLSLTWSSGGFVASISPGTGETASISGSITGVEIGLQHRHTNKNCLTASAKDMAFTAVYRPSTGQNTQPVSSFVFDTSISSAFRLDAYNAWLCFMAVWADDVWRFGTPVKAISCESIPAPVLPTSTDRLAYAVIARVRNISFDVTLPVTQARLQIDPLIIRTTSDGKQTDLAISVGILNLHAKGEISGDITSRNLTMASTRQSTRADDNHTSSTVALAINGGDFTGNAYLEDIRIVQFDLAATKVSLSDDWSARNVDLEEDPVLAFEINAGKFVSVVRLQEVPRLLGLFYKIMQEAENQEARAKQLSKPFRENKARKAGQPSALTTALLQKARKASLTEASPCQLRVKQVMKLGIAGVDLGMFVVDTEGGSPKEHFYLFEIGTVNVDFSRKQNDQNHPLRDIEIIIDAAEWTYYGNGKFRNAEREGKSIVELAKTKYKSPKPKAEKTKADKSKDETTPEKSNKKKKTGLWADGEQAAYIPLATISMSSEQIPSEPVDVLEHNCSLDFSRDEANFIFKSFLWTSAMRTFRQLSHGLDEQQQSRDRDRGSFKRIKRVKEDDDQDEFDNPTAMVYKRMGGAIKVPDLLILGDFTKDLVKWIPNLQNNMNDQSPVVVHRFMTVPLEDAMDQFLKLYEKHLPAAITHSESDAEPDDNKEYTETAKRLDS